MHSAHVGLSIKYLNFIHFLGIEVFNLPPWCIYSVSICMVNRTLALFQAGEEGIGVVVEGVAGTFPSMTRKSTLLQT